ncbi:MAG: aspartyl protease family protein [Verrucomicrobia bacterium]|nr:aspartyl protease family protein [Verrucomicrobiota bacterium]
MRGPLSILVLASALLGPALASAQTNPSSVTLPVEIRRGSLLVKTRINGFEPLTFKLDTGFGITTLHPSLTEPLKLQRVGRLTIVGIAGREQAGTFGGAVFDFGGMKFSPRRVAALPSEANRPRRGRDGILGADFFERFVVELDPKAKTLKLHEPSSFNYTGKGEILPLEFRSDTPIAEATVTLAGRAPVRAKFEIDCGCDDCLCLGRAFCDANGLLDANGKDGRRVGVGGGTGVREGQLASLQLGKLTVVKPSANFFLEGSPAGAGLAGHIGLGALQKFRVIFDYSRKRMILEPL